MAFKVGKQSKIDAYVEQQVERKKRSIEITQRLIKRYLEEPDREYAEDFYGSMLRDRGIDPSALKKGG